MQNLSNTINPPHGLNEINKVFGDIEPFINRDSEGKLTLSPDFERRYIVRLNLPLEIQAAIQPIQKIKSIKCHCLLSDIFAAIFDEIVANNLIPHIHTIDGCFAFRPKRSGSELSVHCWGIAIDINAQTNLQGTNGDMATEIIALFKKFGFAWGGDWKGNKRDPMHFQFCSGY
jgi:hypothetical protein